MSVTPPPAAPMGTMAATLVRLKWSLTLSALKTSAWQVVAMVLAALLAAGFLVGTAVGAFAAGSPMAMANAAWRTLLPAVMVAGGSFAILFVMLMQAMVFGEGSTMGMGKFAPFGIPDRTLQFGLVLASLSGVASLTATACLMLWSMAYRAWGAGPVVAQLVMAPCIVILTVCFCKAMLALLDLLIGSAGGKSVFYVVIMVLVICMAQLPSIVANSGVELSVSSVGALARVLSWLPLGCLFAVPFDVAAGAWWVALARCAIAAVCIVACFLVSSWCLRRQRRTLGAGEGRAHAARGIGAFSLMPDTPAGAIGARILTLLRRDVRQGIFLLLPVLFVLLFFLQSSQIGPWFPFLGVLLAGWFMFMGEANGLAYDGRGFAMQVMAGVDGRTDRRGRVGAYVRLLVPYFAVLFLLAFALGGMWRGGGDLMIGVTLTVAGFSWALASLGVAEVMNCLAPYPVPSLDKPFANPQGRMVAQGLIPFLGLLVGLAVMLPTIGGTLWLLLGAGLEYYPWISAIALANGVGICALGVWWGAKLLDSRMLQVLGTLDRNAALQQ